MQRYLSLLEKRIPQGWKQVQPSKHDTIVVAMSSGVDSSIAAAMYSSFPNVKGIYMRNWSNKQNDMKNCDEKDWNDAKEVAGYLNIPFEMVNFEKEYWIDVFEPMLNNYELGLTPNPDILCNRHIKFGTLKQKLDEMYGANNYWLVTGHYSRILKNRETGQFELLRGIDSSKDQSYYLSQVNPAVLNQTILPIGNFYKKEIRQLAKELQLPTADKPDSQGICFVNNSQQGKFKTFLKEYLPSEPGDIITIDPQSGHKTVWGKHEGLWSYTIGQKVGIPMPQGDPEYRGTWFVSDKLKDTNEIVIVRGRDNRELFKDHVKIDNMKWLFSENDRLNIEQTLQDAIQRGDLYLQYRSLQEPILIKKYEFKEYNTETDRNDQNKNNEFIFTLSSPQRAMAPGQYGCLYLRDRVIGSGTIVS